MINHVDLPEEGLMLFLFKPFHLMEVAKIVKKNVFVNNTFIKKTISLSVTLIGKSTLTLMRRSSRLMKIFIKNLTEGHYSYTIVVGCSCENA